MKALYRILFCILLLQGTLSRAWADNKEGEVVDGCGEDGDCQTCINNAAAVAKQQVESENEANNTPDSSNRQE